MDLVTKGKLLRGISSQWWKKPIRDLGLGENLTTRTDLPPGAFRGKASAQREVTLCYL